MCQGVMKMRIVSWDGWRDYKRNTLFQPEEAMTSLLHCLRSARQKKKSPLRMEVSDVCDQ